MDSIKLIKVSNLEDFISCLLKDEDHNISVDIGTPYIIDGDWFVYIEYYEEKFNDLGYEAIRDSS